MAKGEIVKKVEGEVQKSPAELIQLAITNKVDLIQAEKLLELQAKFEANEARKAYHRAMSEFKANPLIVTKDKLNKQYGSMYTSLSNLVNTVNPLLSKHNLSARWDIEQNGIIKVICRITHVLGHSETASMSALEDKSGSKNPIQQIKSTITYLKSVTFESICGLASTDANVDDDGAGSVSVEYITNQQKNILVDMITATGANLEKVLSYIGTDSLDEVTRAQYDKAVKALDERGKRGKK